jgi:hypothetical protein
MIRIARQLIPYFGTDIWKPGAVVGFRTNNEPIKWASAQVAASAAGKYLVPVQDRAVSRADKRQGLSPAPARDPA